MHWAVFTPQNHSDRIDWIQKNCETFFEYEIIRAKWATGGILYRFIGHQDLVLVLLKWGDDLILSEKMDVYVEN